MNIFETLLGMLTLATACLRDPEVSDGPLGGGTDPGPLSNSNVYTPATDPNEANRIVQGMWQVLSSAPCWVANGNSAVQYSFFGSYQFRYEGFSTTEAGTITLHSVGRYRGLPTALVTTWNTHYLAVINSRTIAITSSPPNGDGFIVVYYHPTNHCL